MKERREIHSRETQIGEDAGYEKFQVQDPPSMRSSLDLEQVEKELDNIDSTKIIVDAQDDQYELNLDKEIKESFQKAYFPKIGLSHENNTYKVDQ